MRPIATAVPVLTALLALSSAGELPLTPVATYPPIRPTPIPYVPTVPVGHLAPPPATLQPQGQQTSALVLTQVPPAPTGSPTDPEKCSQVAARITPQLTPKPTYPAALKGMADKMGGIERDTCGDMDLATRFRSVDAAELNRFTQARYQTFILPLWARVQELWAACGDETGKMASVTQEPCYSWALELCKASNATLGDEIRGGDKDDGDGKLKAPTAPQGNIKTADLDGGAAAVSYTAVMGVAALVLVWAVLA